MGFQEITVCIILGFAIVFIIKKLFVKPKDNNKGCGTDCGC